MAEIGKGAISDDRIRCLLVRDAINGAARSRARSELFVFPFLDYVHLLFQRPCCVTFWYSGSGVTRPILSSFTDPALVPEDFLEAGPRATGDPGWDAYSPVPEVPDVRVAVYSVGPDREEPSSHLARFRFEPQWTAQLRAVLVTEEGEDLAVRFHHDVKRLLESPTVARLHAGRPDITTAVALDDALRQDVTGRIAKVIGRALNEFRDSRLLYVESIRVFNLFAATRWIDGPTPRYRGSFPYTAALTLGEEQLVEVRSWLEQRAAAGEGGALERVLRSDWESLLQKPLHRESRAVFDSPTASGFVDFSRTGSAGEAGGWRDQGPQEDNPRREIENLIYEPLVKQIVGDGGGAAAIFYIPIHVAGVPWLSLFTFADTSPRGWFQHYSLYRDVIHRLGDTLRRELRAAYVEALATPFRAALRKPAAEIARSVSAQWSQLAQMFPYERLALGPTADMQGTDASLALKLPNGEQLRIESSPNLFYPSQIRDFDVPSLAEIVDHLQDQANQTIEVVRAERNQTAKILRDLAHDLTGPLSVTADQLTKEVSRIPDMPEAAANSLSAAATALDIAYSIVLAHQRHANAIGAVRSRAVEDPAKHWAEGHTDIVERAEAIMRHPFVLNQLRKAPGASIDPLKIEGQRSSVRGHRAAWTVVLFNLIKNAVQASKAAPENVDRTIRTRLVFGDRAIAGDLKLYFALEMENAVDPAVWSRMSAIQACLSGATEELEPDQHNEESRGLGLSIVRDVVRSFGAKVEFIRIGESTAQLRISRVEVIKT